jgi:hypothetical protein
VTHPISIRLNDAKWQEYSNAAQARGVGLSTYLKQRLEQGDAVAAELSALRRAVARLEAGKPAHHADGADSGGLCAVDRGLLTEAVLLLRAALPPEKLALTHGELRRQGLPVWSGSNELGGSRR